jgi:hypothetical protein
VFQADDGLGLSCKFEMIEGTDAYYELIKPEYMQILNPNLIKGSFV